MIRPATRFLDRTTPPHLFTLVAVTAVSALSMSVFLPSLTSMSRYFEADYRVLQLSVTLYLAGNAVMQLFVGPLSDRFGRRPVLLGGFLMFCIATLGCIFAPNVAVFLAFRMLQACVVAGVVLGRAVVRDIHGAEESAAMIGWVTMAMSIVPLVGPAAGGWLDEVFGWQGSFVLLFVLGLGTFALIWSDLGETATALGRPLSAQLRDYPVLFRSPRFWGYAICSSLASGCFFAFLGGAPFVGETVFGMSPRDVGFALGSPALGYATGNFLSGRFSVRFGIDRMVVAGTTLAALGIGLDLALVLSGHRGPVLFFGLVAVMAMGNGMSLPNCVAGLLSVRPQLAGSASGLGGALQIAGGALMATLSGMVLTAESGVAPLLLVMLGSALGSIVAILLVIARARSKGIRV